MPFRLNRTENEPHFNPRDLRPAIINSIIPENIFIRNLFALKLKNPIMFSRRSLILPPNSVSFSFLNVIYLGGGLFPPPVIIIMLLHFKCWFTTILFHRLNIEEIENSRLHQFSIITLSLPRRIFMHANVHYCTFFYLNAFCILDKKIYITAIYAAH